MSYGYDRYSNSDMSSRGRGFNSRGGSSYRGNRGGSSSGNWDNNSNSSNMSRGGYNSSSRGGRFKYSTPNYDSRNKYNNSSGGSERYTNRGGRGDHSNNYKRPRDSYSARDDHRSSSESNRKRVRNDSYQGEGSSGSQRYPSSYSGSASSAGYNDNKRSSSSAVYDDKRAGDRGSSYHRSEERHSSTSRNYGAPPPPRISDMAPPAQRYSGNRGRVSRQGSNYRGRASARGRGSNFRVGSSRSDLMSRKRSALEYRRKLLSSRSRDYIQRVRMASSKIRRSGTRLSGSKKESGSGSSVKDKDRDLAKAINDEFSDEDDEDKDADDNWIVDEKAVKNDDSQRENSESEKSKSKDEKRKKEKSDRQSVADENEEEKSQEMKREESTDKRETEEDDREKDKERNEKEEGAESDDALNRRDRHYIKLTCPHCSHHSVTFKDYSLHLFSGRHNTAMRRIAARHKASLARMRVLQRQDQRRKEAREAAQGTLPSRTMFCQICKLNYRSLKKKHHLSESHHQIKRFLTPFCRVCRIQFRSPMLFETHVCSLDHIKRKSALDERRNSGNTEGDGDSSGPEEDDKDHNLENFMTLDSVGDVDAEEDDESGEKKKKEKMENDNSTSEQTENKKPKNKQMIKVGVEYIKRVEVQYCELCKVYLPRNENSERALAMHCSTRSHLQRYVRDNNDKALRREAERIHLQTSSSSTNNTNSSNSTGTSEAIKGSPHASPQQNNPSSNGNSNSMEASNTVEDASEIEQTQNPSESQVNCKQEDNKSQEEDEDDYRNDGDKLWDDVDKDLGDILREVEPGKSSDDEDTRYDRFKNSDKKAQQQQHKDKNNEDTDNDNNTKKLECKVKLEKIDK